MIVCKTVQRKLNFYIFNDVTKFRYCVSQLSLTNIEFVQVNYKQVIQISWENLLQKQFMTLKEKHYITVN